MKQTQIGDIGRDEGIQYTTGTLGKSEIIVLNNVAYMKGDESALKYQLGYSQREATAYENRWISFTASDSAYADVTDLVTLGSFWSDPNTNAFISVTQSPQSETGESRFDRQQAQSITYSIHDIVKSSNWSFVGTSELYFAAKAPHLPLASISRTTGTLDGIKDLQKDSGTFTKWGERVDVTAPKGAVPFSSVIPAPSS